MIKYTEANIKANAYLRADRELSKRITLLETATPPPVVVPLSTQNVKFYGAIGNGIADDTTSIQTCINANTSRIYFPNGTYKITGELLINNKLNFQIDCENVIILQDHANTALYCIKITNCRNPIFSGRITLQSNRSVASFITTDVTTGCGNGLYVYQCRCGGFNNISVLGPFIIGIALYNQDLTHEKQNFQGLVVTNCNTGIHMFGEYYTILDSTINYNRTGVLNLGGNNCVESSGLNFNRVAIIIIGNTGNSDHGKIVGCTINHNQACGILIKNTIKSYHITGCSIWGNSMGQELIVGTDIIATTTNSFGIYLENVENINVCGNDIAGNIVNMGLNGYVCCNITGNTFIAVEMPQPANRNSRHIVEYGGAHNTYGRNFQNVISGNTFYGELSGTTTPSVDGFRIKFFNNVADSAKDDSTICVENNRGTTGSHILNLSTTGGAANTVLLDPNYESVVLHVSNNSIVKLHHSFGGSTLQITILGITSGQTKYIELNQASSYTAAESPIIVGVGCVYDSTTKRYTFSANGLYTFVPVGPNVNNWIVNCP
jgi:hypothetical protein